MTNDDLIRMCAFDTDSVVNSLVLYCQGTLIIYITRGLIRNG